MSHYCQTCFEVPVGGHLADKVVIAHGMAECEPSMCRAIAKVPARQVHSLQVENQVIWHWWDLMSQAHGVTKDDFMMPEHFSLTRSDNDMRLVIDSIKADCGALGAFVQGILRGTMVDMPVPIRCAVYSDTLKPGEDHGNNLLVTKDSVIQDLGNRELDVELEALKASIEYYVVPVKEKVSGRIFNNQVLMSCLQGTAAGTAALHAAGTWAKDKHIPSDIEGNNKQGVSIEVGTPRRITAYQHLLLSEHLDAG